MKMAWLAPTATEYRVRGSVMGLRDGDGTFSVYSIPLDRWVHTNIC